MCENSLTNLFVKLQTALVSPATCKDKWTIQLTNTHTYVCTYVHTYYRKYAKLRTYVHVHITFVHTSMSGVVTAMVHSLVILILTVNNLVCTYVQYILVKLS